MPEGFFKVLGSRICVDISCEGKPLDHPLIYELIFFKLAMEFFSSEGIFLREKLQSTFQKNASIT